MNRFVWCVLVASSYAVLAGGARADSLVDTFARGNAAYARADYDAAVSEYQTLLESGIDDADVAYNLACAHGAGGHYGDSIRYFERSLRLRPGDDAAERGLKLARDALGERQAKELGEAIVAERPPLSSALFSSLSEDALAIAALLSTWLCCAALLGLLVARAEAVRIGLGISVAALAFLGLVSGFGLWAKTDFGADGTRAVVLHDRVPLREGPDQGSRRAGELSEGESLRILSNGGSFVRVRSARGVEGFVPAADVGEI